MVSSHGRNLSAANPHVLDQAPTPRMETTSLLGLTDQTESRGDGAYVEPDDCDIAHEALGAWNFLYAKSTGASLPPDLRRRATQLSKSTAEKAAATAPAR
eukprot:UN05960